VDDGLKQRLVGAVVLAAIAVIFLPSLFDEDSRRRVDTSSKIPPVKTLSPAKFSAPVRSAGVDPAPAAESMYHLVEEAPEAAAEQAAVKKAQNKQNTTEKAESERQAKVAAVKPSLNTQGVPTAWVIQVASFKTQDRANTLRAQLIKDGYKAYLQSADTSRGKAHRVLVGPKIDKAQANKIKAALDKALKVDTLIKRFEP